MRLVYPTLAGLLTVVFFSTTCSESSQKSPSSDEPPHIASGLAYVAKGNFRGNPQHPPLIKELSGLSLRMAGIEWQVNPETERFLHGEIRKGEQPEWAIGNKLIADNGPDRVLFWARLPVMLLTATLPIALYLLGSQLIGPLAGLAAAFLCTMSPTVVGHAFLVTTDVGLATLTVWFLYALWRYLDKPTHVRLAASGLLLGLAMAAKFSAVFLLPVVVVLLVAAQQKTAAPAPVPTADRNDPCPCGSGKKYKNCHMQAASSSGTDWTAAIKSAALPAIILFAIAFVVIQITYASFDPLVYYRGLMKVNADHNPNYQVILGSELSRRFFTYFPSAWLLKEPVASIVFTLAGLFFVWRSKHLTARARLFLLLPPAVILPVHALLADNLGIRYVMSVFPFAHLAGGFGLVSLAGRSNALRAVCCVLCLWLSSAALGIYPDHLSYFNEAACLSNPSRIGIDGGSRCGVEWLDDSNVDWGQGLKQLKSWLDANAAGRPVYLDNPFRFPATAYGIQAHNVSPDDLLAGPQAGIYAISAHYVARLPLLDSRLQWLRSTPPRAIVGHGIYIYDFAAR